MKKIACLTLLFAIILLTAAANSALAQAVRVSFLEGRAWVSAGGQTAKEHSLDKGQLIEPGQMIRTEAGAKAELTISGRGMLRLGPSSVIRVLPEKGQGQYTAPRAQALLISGELWVTGKTGAQQPPIGIATASCLANTTDGVFRLTLYPDRTVEVKAYGGTIRVSGPEAPPPGMAPSPPPASPAPTAPPAPWKYDLSPHTKMVVWPDGSATRPFRFVARADLTAWVQWNLERDKTAEGAP